MSMRKTLLSATCMALALSAGLFTAAPAQAQEQGNMAYYQISDEEYDRHYMEWRRYIEYNSTMREPCQNYVAPPAGFYVMNCEIYRVEQPRVAVQETPQPQVQQTTTLLPIVSTYTIYFDFDKSNIRASEQPTIDRLASELNKYNPTQVTVAGHADTSGPADYNRALSDRRAQSVAAALTARGIENQVIDKEAYGESMPAVQTGDGVKLEENRRVVVDFRR